MFTYRSKIVLLAIKQLFLNSNTKEVIVIMDNIKILYSNIFENNVIKISQLQTLFKINNKFN